jgi:hypothetical protein
MFSAKKSIAFFLANLISILQISAYFNFFLSNGTIKTQVLKRLAQLLQENQ